MVWPERLATLVSRSGPVTPPDERLMDEKGRTQVPRVE
ncbi:MAG: hypothetical protein QOF30_1988 [Acidimicrobiaceae bacterium]|jgi:hypothetical protein|nr:hypothetical protein [Acidimicrobiaceae bacterium]